MRRVSGNKLHAADRKHVLAAYVYRMTTESRERWPDATRVMLRGHYRMPERTDAEWLANTMFSVRKDGRLDGRVRHCETSH